jgi:hypothetical protein
MKRTLTIILTAGLIAGCSAEYQEAATTAPREPARVDQPAPVRPEPEPEPDIPNTYGDDRFFDRLWDQCDDGDLDACEELFWESPVGSEYESYALDRIDELENALSDRDIVDAVGADFLLDLSWDTLTSREQRDLCDGARLFGFDVAGSILSEGSDGLVTSREAADWLSRKCR